jgi:hypothetical protein
MGIARNAPFAQMRNAAEIKHWSGFQPFSMNACGQIFARSNFMPWHPETRGRDVM